MRVVERRDEHELVRQDRRRLNAGVAWRAAADRDVGAVIEHEVEDGLAVRDGERQADALTRSENARMSGGTNELLRPSSRPPGAGAVGELRCLRRPPAFVEQADDVGGAGANAVRPLSGGCRGPRAR